MMGIVLFGGGGGEGCMLNSGSGRKRRGWVGWYGVDNYYVRVLHICLYIILLEVALLCF